MGPPDCFHLSHLLSRPRTGTVSSDGKALLFLESGEGAGKYYACYLRASDGSPAVKLGNGRAPALSPDGRFAVAAGVQDHPETLLIFPTGAGETRYLPLKGYNIVNVYWIPDGSGIVFVGSQAGSGMRLHIVSLEGGTPRPLTTEGIRRLGVTVTPDGKAVTGINAAGELALYPIAGGQPRPFSGIEPGEVPIRWSGDGASLYVYRRSELPARVMRVDAKTGRRELWKEITPADRAGVNGVSTVRLTPDGQSYAYSVVQRLSELHMVERLK